MPHPQYPILKAAIDQWDKNELRRLLTMRVRKSYEFGTWAGSHTEYYDTDILSLQPFEAELDLASIRIIEHLFPEILLNRINMEIAVCKAIDANDQAYLAVLLNKIKNPHGIIRDSSDPITSWPGFNDELRHFCYRTVLIHALKKYDYNVNSPIVLQLLSMPQENLISSASHIPEFRAFVISQLEFFFGTPAQPVDVQGVSLISEQAEWFFHNIPYLVRDAHTIPNYPYYLQALLHHPLIRSQFELIKTDHFHVSYAADNHDNFSIKCLLSVPTLFRDMENLQRRAVAHPRIYASALKHYQETFNVLHSIIEEKLQYLRDEKQRFEPSDENPIFDIHGEDINLCFSMLENLMGQEKPYSSMDTVHIQLLLSLPSVLSKLETHTKHFAHLALKYPHSNYRLLLEVPSVLKAAVRIPIEEINKNLSKIVVTGTMSTLFSAIQEQVNTMQTTLDSAVNTAAIRAGINSMVPPIRNQLRQLDNQMGKTISQLIKNTMHWLGAILSLGQHYRTRIAELGQFTFHSEIIEKTIRSSLKCSFFSEERSNIHPSSANTMAMDETTASALAV